MHSLRILLPTPWKPTRKCRARQSAWFFHAKTFADLEFPLLYQFKRHPGMKCNSNGSESYPEILELQNIQHFWLRSTTTTAESLYTDVHSQSVKLRRWCMAQCSQVHAGHRGFRNVHTLLRFPKELHCATVAPWGWRCEPRGHNGWTVIAPQVSWLSHVESPCQCVLLLIIPVNC